MCSPNTTNTRPFAWTVDDTPFQIANTNNITFLGNTLATDGNCARSQADYAMTVYLLNVTQVHGVVMPTYNNTPPASSFQARLPARADPGGQLGSLGSNSAPTAPLLVPGSKQTLT